MKKIILFVSLAIILQHGQAQNTRVDGLQQEIDILKERIDSLKNEIQNEILRDGYFLTVKSGYSYSEIKMKDKEYGTVIDTIVNGDNVKIIDKTIGYFKVLYHGKSGYISAHDIDITEHPALNILESSYLRESASSNSDYSTGSSGGSVNVKGYYRKDGTYVKPHTRKAPKSSGRRRR
jgi:hypothetical protein